MFDKELFDRICSVSCSWDELEEFATNIKEKEVDSENPFEKYYSVDRLITAIEKYQAKEIDANFLSYWMFAYGWIVAGGYPIEEQNNIVSLKDFLMWEIVDWIDSLAAFDGDEDIYDLRAYKKRYKVLDSVLQDLGQCNAVYAALGYGERSVIVLIANDTAKYFIEIYGELDYGKKEVDMETTAAFLLADKERRLLDAGYRELKYRNFTEEEL